MILVARKIKVASTVGTLKDSAVDIFPWQPPADKKSYVQRNSWCQMPLYQSCFYIGLHQIFTALTKAIMFSLILGRTLGQRFIHQNEPTVDELCTRT